MNRPATLPDAALAYAGGAVGPAIPVIPLEPGGKLPHRGLGWREYDENGEGVPGTGGVSWATADLTQVAAWWDRWPTANIGGALGRAGLVCLDIEGANKGFDPADAVDAMIEAFGHVPITLTAWTAGGGFHFLYRHPHATAEGWGSMLRGVDGVPIPGVEVRAGERYVVLEPSVRDGGSWRFVGWVPPEPAPAWLHPREVLSREPEAVSLPRFAPGVGGTRYGLAGLRGEVERLREAVEPGRHDQLFRSAVAVGELVAGGQLDGHVAIEALRLAAGECGLLPTRQTEVERTLRDGLAKGLGQPRSGSGAR